MIHEDGHNYPLSNEILAYEYLSQRSIVLGVFPIGNDECLLGGGARARTAGPPLLVLRRIQAYDGAMKPFSNIARVVARRAIVGLDLPLALLLSLIFALPSRAAGAPAGFSERTFANINATVRIRDGVGVGLSTPFTVLPDEKRAAIYVPDTGGILLVEGSDVRHHFPLPNVPADGSAAIDDLQSTEALLVGGKWTPTELITAELHIFDLQTGRLLAKVETRNPHLGGAASALAHFLWRVVVDEDTVGVYDPRLGASVPLWVRGLGPVPSDQQMPRMRAGIGFGRVVSWIPTEDGKVAIRREGKTYPLDVPPGLVFLDALPGSAVGEGSAGKSRALSAPQDAPQRPPQQSPSQITQQSPPQNLPREESDLAWALWLGAPEGSTNQQKGDTLSGLEFLGLGPPSSRPWKGTATFFAAPASFSGGADFSNSGTTSSDAMRATLLTTAPGPLLFQVRVAIETGTTTNLTRNWITGRPACARPAGIYFPRLQFDDVVIERLSR